MKLNFICILLLVNFFYKAAFSSEKNNQKVIIPKDNTGKLLEQKDFSKRKFHIVKKGDTLLRISRKYSLEKKFLIKINQLQDENYIYIGQNLKLSDDIQNKKNAQNKNIPKYHLILIGENLTDISNKYGLDINDLINLNKLVDPDNIEVGTNLLLINPSENIEQKTPSISRISKNSLLDIKQYGPLTVESTKLETLKGRKTLNVINKNKKKLILSLNCEKKEIDVRKKNKKWKGWMPVKEKFEERLINDFC